ncbi:glycosyltransferase family 39 protein [Candidatus Daviesbacteria bacterium]|nr:glycosyltransferase family 39 protein [Candidatus Daviesbacteria bacterium]
MNKQNAPQKIYTCPMHFLVRHSLFILLYLFFLIFIFLTFKDYGISWDESFYLNSGKVYFENFFNPQEVSKLIPQYHLVTHGAFFDVLYYLILKIFNQTSSFEFLHLVKALFASITLIFIYASINILTRNRYVSLVGTLLFIFSPRWLGDIFDNHMDITATLLTSIIILLSLKIFSDKKSEIWGLPLYGLVSAIAFSHRVILIIFPALFIYLYIFKKFKKEELNSNYIGFILSFLVFIAALFLTDPYIRINGLLGIVEKAIYFTFFNKDITILFEGKFYPATNLPWYYFVKQILITSPLIIIFLTISGALFMIKKFINLGFIKTTSHIYLLMSLYIIFVLVYIFKPVTFDSWRHFLFLIVPMVLIAALGLNFIFQSRRIYLKLIFILLVVNSILVIKDVYGLYPYHYMYFNELIGGIKGAYKNYETEYWGKSYKEAILWLKENEIKETKLYKLATCSNPTQSAYYFADNMIHTKNLGEADYFICITKNNEHNKVGGEIVHTVIREGVPLNFIKKMD